MEYHFHETLIREKINKWMELRAQSTVVSQILLNPKHINLGYSVTIQVSSPKYAHEACLSDSCTCAVYTGEVAEGAVREVCEYHFLHSSSTTTDMSADLISRSF